jgi:hypothetical protein
MLDADEVPAGALLLAAVSSRNEMMLEDALKRPQKESDEEARHNWAFSFLLVLPFYSLYDTTIGEHRAQ